LRGAPGSAIERAMLVIEDLSVRVAGRLLIEQASVRIPEGARIGFVGRNGSGKSTLFNVITGDVAAEHGDVEFPPRWRLGRLAQEAPNGPESLIDVVLKADVERVTLLQRADTETDPHEIAEIHLRLADTGAYAAPARAASILSGLGFSAADQQRPCSEFSGGWRMRVALAATLFAEPELLLLDEPTNYLDLEGTLWLQDHLARYPRTMIVISHDRDLLDTSVDQILSLENCKLTLYRGGYSDFERLRSERLMLDQKMVKKRRRSESTSRPSSTVSRPRRPRRVRHSRASRCWRRWRRSRPSSRTKCFPSSFPNRIGCSRRRSSRSTT
jgi:ATP-binding cassette subfamily F protein 3